MCGVSLQLAASPMCVFARRVKRPLNVSVQCPHDTDPRKHRWAAQRRHQDQGFHCSLPFSGLVNGLRKLRDVVAGVLQRDERGAARQRYRIVKWSLPTLWRFHRPGEPGGIRCLFFGFGGSSNRSIAFSADSIPACRSGALPDFVCPSKTTDHFHSPVRP
jgi:hypothetical protein